MSFVEKNGSPEDADTKEFGENTDDWDHNVDKEEEDSLCSSHSTSYSYVSDDDFGCFQENANIAVAEMISPGGALFNCDPITCPVCFVEADAGEALTLPDCHHSFCVECFKKYISTQIHDGKANQIICPMPATECGRLVTRTTLEDVLDLQTYEKLLYWQQSSFVLSNPEYHHCPTPDCSNVVYWKDGQLPIVDCFKCGKISCVHCNASPYHTGMSCEEYRKHLLVETQKRRRKRQWRLATRTSIDRSRAGEELRHDYKPTDDTLLELNIRICRRCGSGIEHDGDSCLKMKCLCGYRFCFICGDVNAQCNCTPSAHGFTDNVTGFGDFTGLNEKESYT